MSFYVQKDELYGYEQGKSLTSTEGDLFDGHGTQLVVRLPHERMIPSSGSLAFLLGHVVYYSRERNLILPNFSWMKGVNYDLM